MKLTFGISGPDTLVVNQIDQSNNPGESEEYQQRAPKNDASPFSAHPPQFAPRKRPFVSRHDLKQGFEEFVKAYDQSQQRHHSNANVTA